MNFEKHKRNVMVHPQNHYAGKKKLQKLSRWIFFFTKIAAQAQGGVNSLFQYSVKTLLPLGAQREGKRRTGGGAVGRTALRSNPSFFLPPSV